MCIRDRRGTSCDDRLTQTLGRMTLYPVRWRLHGESAFVRFSTLTLLTVCGLFFFCYSCTLAAAQFIDVHKIFHYFSGVEMCQSVYVVSPFLQNYVRPLEFAGRFVIIRVTQDIAHLVHAIPGWNFGPASRGSPRNIKEGYVTGGGADDGPCKPICVLSVRAGPRSVHRSVM